MQMDAKRSKRCLLHKFRSTIWNNRETAKIYPKNVKYRLDREEAVKVLEEQNRKGRVFTVWFQPVPYINAICSCETPQCGGLRLRMDFDLKTVYKAEYVAQADPDLCQGCKTCVSYCQFGAIKYSPTLKRVLIDQKNVWMRFVQRSLSARCNKTCSKRRNSRT